MKFNLHEEGFGGFSGVYAHGKISEHTILEIKPSRICNDMRKYCFIIGRDVPRAFDGMILLCYNYTYDRIRYIRMTTAQRKVPLRKK